MAQQSPRTEELNKKFVEAFKTRNFAPVAAMFADDAVILPPRRNIVTGRDTIQSFWTQSRRLLDLKFESISFTPLGGDVAREIGFLSMRMKRGGGRRQNQRGGEGEQAFLEVSGKYLFLWRKVGGEWKLESIMWNINRRDPEEEPE